MSYFSQELRKTYSRRSKANAPKTFRDKLKRVGGLVPIVALSKAAINSSQARPQGRQPQGNSSQAIPQGRQPQGRQPQGNSSQARPQRRQPQGRQPQGNYSQAKPQGRPSSKPYLLPTVKLDTPKDKKEGMSMGMKIGIAAGVVGLGLVTYLVVKNK